MMRRPFVRRLLGVLATLGVAAGIAIYGVFTGWFTTKQSPAALSATLRPFDVVAKPDGPGPFPTAILFHGCGGDWHQQRGWAWFLAAHGYAAVAVDSLSPRGIDAAGAMQTVCRGRALWGRERAGDVAVSLADVRAMPFVDPQRIVLMGWSHGAWSIMDLLALDAAGGRPTNLAALPAGGLDGVRGLVFFYPYCGFGALASGTGWRHTAPMLMLLAGRDSIAPLAATQALTDVLRHTGHDVAIEMFSDVDHAFDVPELPSGGALRFEPEATELAQEKVLAFLAQATAKDRVVAPR